MRLLSRGGLYSHLLALIKLPWTIKTLRTPPTLTATQTPPHTHTHPNQHRPQGVLRAGLDIEKAPHTISKETFPLPTLGPVLEAIREDVATGRGFALVRGFPVERYSRKETMIGYWGLGLYWGKAGSNNKNGHLIGHIKVGLVGGLGLRGRVWMGRGRDGGGGGAAGAAETNLTKPLRSAHAANLAQDIGHDPANPLTRLYATAAAQPCVSTGPGCLRCTSFPRLPPLQPLKQPTHQTLTQPPPLNQTTTPTTTNHHSYHNDAADIVTLLCLKNARSGGLSSWSSSVSVHNEILRRRPDLGPVLAGDWCVMGGGCVMGRGGEGVGPWRGHQRVQEISGITGSKPRCSTGPSTAPPNNPTPLSCRFFDRKGEVPPGKKPFFAIPVFNYFKGYLSINYS